MRALLAFIALLTLWSVYPAFAQNGESVGASVPTQNQIDYLREIERSNFEDFPRRIHTEGDDRKGLGPLERFIENRFIIKLNPNIDNVDGIKSILEEYNIEIETSIPILGLVYARYNGQLPNEWRRFSATDKYIYYFDIIEKLEDFEIIQSATIDVVLEHNVLEITADPVSIQSSEIEDWGLGDRGIDVLNLWEDIGSERVSFGIVDTGFSDHVDLKIKETIGDIISGEHGNHIAGILAASHNGVGVKGVFPNADLFIATGGPVLPNLVVIDTPYENADSLYDYIAAFIRLRDVDGLKIYNTSVGYNFKTYMSVIHNPESVSFDPIKKREREVMLKILEGQRDIVYTLFDILALDGGLLFSSAGNDSTAWDKYEAIYSSPFNMASNAFLEKTGVRVGIIIESNHENGTTSSFSNKGGDLSCPGEDVFSVYTGPDQYTKLDGTSQAAPYCTGAFAMISVLRPKYESSEIIKCMINSGVPSSNGTPRANVRRALEECPAR